MTNMAVTSFDRHIRKPHAARKRRDSMFCRTEVIADRSFTLREYVFWTI